MKIETRLDFRKYLKLMYLLFYRKPWAIIITIIGLTMLVLSILYFLGYHMTLDKPPFALLIIGLITIFIPVSIFKSARKAFSSHGRLQEKMVYEFTLDKIIITGETFKTEMDWTKLYKIQELKDWILIYNNKINANVIPKESFGEDLRDFKNIVVENKIKSNFKKNLILTGGMCNWLRRARIECGFQVASQGGIQINPRLPSSGLDRLAMTPNISRVAFQFFTMVVILLDLHKPKTFENESIEN
jgi:hypothetical protein